jgi:hypothetical protein
LLSQESDLSRAKDLYPQIFHVLDDPKLRAKFETYNNAADEAKRRVYTLGFVSVVCAMMALLSSVAAPLLEPLFRSTALRLTFVAIEAIGLTGVAISYFGLALAPTKRRWLVARFMAERLRQWHFQLLVTKGAEVASSCSIDKAGAVGDFVTALDIWRTSFIDHLEASPYADLEIF